MYAGSANYDGVPCTVIDVDPEDSGGAAGSRFYSVAAGRRLVSSVSGYLNDQFTLAARKIFCTEPLATLFMRRYVSDSDFANAQWMLNSGMVLKSWHRPLLQQALINNDHDMVVLLLKNSEPSDSLLEVMLDISPYTFFDLVADELLTLTESHYCLVVFAATRGKLNVVRGLVAGGAPAFRQGEGLNCTSALEAAALNNHDGTVQYLAKAGALKSLLTDEFVQKSPATVHKLLQKNQLKLDADYYPLVLGAAARGDLEILKLLLASGAPASCHDEDYAQSALLHALIFGRVDTFKFLISQGANRAAADWFCLSSPEERDVFIERIKQSGQ